MVLRLVLVGIVAGLGVSPPAERGVAGWSRSVQTWLDGRLAEGNERGPLDEDAVACEAVAVECSEEAEDDVTVSASALVATARSEDEVRAEAVAFDAVVDEMVAEFSRIEAATWTPAQVAPALTSDQRTGAVDSPELELVDAWGRVAEAIEGFPTKVEMVLRGRDFEPIEVGEDLYPGEAYALNRVAEGLGEAVPAVDVESAGGMSPGNRLGTAVRLTRDAVYAWMNLLQGPAIVTISH